MKRRTVKPRNPVARVVRALRPGVKPSAKVYRRQRRTR